MDVETKTDASGSQSKKPASQSQKRKRTFKPTVDDILQDHVTPIAQEYWAPGNPEPNAYDAALVQKLYNEELSLGSPSRVAILEFSQYLENYLWKNYSKNATVEHVLSTVLMMNEKFRAVGSVSVWEVFHSKESEFVPFLRRVAALPSERELTVPERTAWVVFLINCFQTLEDQTVREFCLRLVNLPLWHHLKPSSRSRVLREYPELAAKWSVVNANADSHKVDADFIPGLVNFVLTAVGSQTLPSEKEMICVERIVELLIDLLAQLHTRRFLNPYLKDINFVVLCQTSQIASSDSKRGRLFTQLFGFLRDYQELEVDEREGDVLDDNERVLAHYNEVQRLQRIAFKHFPEKLTSLALANVSAIDTREALQSVAESLSHEELYRLCCLCRLIADTEGGSGANGYEGHTLQEIFVSAFSRRSSQTTKVKELSLYPDEDILFDENLVPSMGYNGERALALPKLNLQFLTFHDYLLRNFNLFRLESTYEIREDIRKAVKLIRPKLSSSTMNTVFTGFARYAVPTISFGIRKVGKPLIGETKPSTVVGEVTVNLAPFNANIRREWEGIRIHDVLFLATIQATPAMGRHGRDQNGHQQGSGSENKKDNGVDWNKASGADLGVKYVRGAQVLKVLDEAKNVVGERNEKGEITQPKGNIRTFIVLLDAAQYSADQAKTAKGEEDPYQTFNLCIRRKPQENNFRSILETIRNIMVTRGEALIPSWMHDVFLGYGSPDSALYYNLDSELSQLQFSDTFLDLDHLKASFPGYTLTVEDGASTSQSGPFEIVFPTNITPPLRKGSATKSGSPPAIGNGPLAAAAASGHSDEAEVSSTTKKKKVKLAEQDEKEKEASEAPEKKSPEPSAPKLTEAEVKAMKVAELRAALKERDLNASGRKAELAARLLEAVQQENEQEDSASAMEVEPKAEITPVAVAASPADATGGSTAMEEEKEVVKGATALVSSSSESEPVIQVRSVPMKELRPFASHTPQRNRVRFTPMQVEAIRSGLNPGLTMIVGPPGTGKTDVAVQILSELHYNFPEQRTLLITHSNHALNDLFAKLMQRNIDERYLLRLGHGENSLADDKDFSKFGRVNHMLERRLQLLEFVGMLAESMEEPKDVAYSCETAGHFFLNKVVAEWERFSLDAASLGNGTTGAVEKLSSSYPFLSFYNASYGADAEPLFDATATIDANKARAYSHYTSISALFQELDEVQPFEVLRSGRDRGNYLLTKHARVIAMTCTHAAIKRDEFLKLGLQYDNIVMEEAAQVLEIETFIPMVLQKHDSEAGCRLKRITLLGDHNQLPPIVQNMAFQQFSRLDQSMFTRFVRLGMSCVQLNAQGRSRPSLASLWNWRYNELSNLPCVSPNTGNGANNSLTDPRFGAPNVGLPYDYQFIDVGKFQDQDETTPAPFFYQNLGEAEYVVQTYMYMRLLGYPAQKISIITTYNGQKSLIEDVVSLRCANNPLYGRPAHISTVDKFQGQQNDFVLLSLVRTKTPGHVRDIRRLVVAMSRSRLGLYVFGRVSLFKNCLELTPTISALLQNPTKLVLKHEELGIDAQVRDVVQMGELVANLEYKIRKDPKLFDDRLSAHRSLEREREEKLRREEARREAIAQQARADAETENAEKQKTQAMEADEEMMKKVADVEKA